MSHLVFKSEGLLGRAGGERQSPALVGCCSRCGFLGRHCRRGLERIEIRGGCRTGSQCRIRRGTIGSFGGCLLSLLNRCLFLLSQRFRGIEFIGEREPDSEQKAQSHQED